MAEQYGRYTLKWTCPNCGKDIGDTSQYGVIYHCEGFRVPVLFVNGDHAITEGQLPGWDRELYQRITIKRDKPDPVTGNTIFQGNMPVGLILIDYLTGKRDRNELHPEIANEINRIERLLKGGSDSAPSVEA